MKDKLIKDQQEFVDWLKSKGIYNPVLSSNVMHFGFRVWKAFNTTQPKQEMVEKIDYTKCPDCSTEDIVYYGTCGKCGLKWIVEAKKLANIKPDNYTCGICNDEKTLNPGPGVQIPCPNCSVPKGKNDEPFNK